MKDLDLSGLVVLHDEAEIVLEAVAKSGVAEALAQIGVTDQGITELANGRALKWAEARAAEMVGKRKVKGKLIDNPNAEWRIDEATRELLRGFVSEAIDQGWSNAKLAKEIGHAFAFSDERSMMIARTETAFADVAGNMAAYRSSKIVTGKRWVTSNLQGCCDDCDGNRDQGVVALNKKFQSGDDAPPAHPNCRCDVVPVLSDDEDD